MTPDIVAFIRARLDERADALDKLIHYQDNFGDVPGMDGGWEHWGDFGYLVGQVVDFRRMRRGVEAKRQLLDEIFEYEAKIDGEWGCSCSATDIAAGGCGGTSLDGIKALRIMASEFADHPDYRQEWTV